MDSAFLVFLVAMDTCFQCSAIPDVSSIQKLDDPEEEVGLIFRDES
jgi:hypothetical protein